MQNVTFEMINFNSLLKSHEEIVIRRYIDKCVVFYGLFIFIFYFISIASLLVPIVLPQPFPTLAEYPFDVLYQPLKTIIYSQQCVVAIIVAGQLCSNGYMGLLLWFTSARFEMLTEEMKKVTNIYQLFKCIEKHQELFKYVSQSLSLMGII